MGRSDYLVSAGIGFDLDRSSARKSIGVFESIANTLNATASKKAAEGFAKTEEEYAKTVGKLKKTSQQADKDLLDGTFKSAKAAQDALDKSMMKAPSQASKGAVAAAGGLKAYKKEYAATVGAMKSSYAKFASEAEKIGIKFSKGSKMSMEQFATKDVETRKQAINLTKRMIKDEKARLATLTEGSKGYEDLSKEIKHLQEQEKQMVNLSEDVFQQERKTQKIKQKAATDERAAEKKKIMSQKKILMGLKTLQQNTAKLGRIAQDSASKISGGLQNAFVIGTAAAGAFFYKLEPLAQTVQDFEKTIINANSVFNVTKETLFDVSDTMVKFTLKYGVAANEMAEGLYQLASAGLSASESQEVLQHTMKLAMATQGDHNTLAKLTTQTIMGFGMGMEDAGMLTDKFAHSIQKSLIEWQDLASSVKFAMPFFVATGQSIDELLGGLEVLTNRALEAGIAGRGLRQALAQFAKHADNNASALAKMGVEIMGANGEMRDLHDIAKDAQVAFGDISGTEQLTAMLEDMNVRGATAFALLVQNADEFGSAVDDLANSAGSATQMAETQQESLANQIQLVKNALLAPFIFSDEVGAANNTLNEFTFIMQELVQDFVDFFIVVENGEEKLTAASKEVKAFVIDALRIAVDVISDLKDIFLESEEGLTGFTNILQMAVVPLELMLSLLNSLEPSTMKLIIQFQMLNKILPITNAIQFMLQMRMMKSALAMNAEGVAVKKNAVLYDLYNGKTLSTTKIKKLVIADSYMMAAAAKAEALGLMTVDYAAKSVRLTMLGLMASMGLVVGLFVAATMAGDGLANVLMAIAAVVGVLAIMNYMEWGSDKGPLGWAAAAAGVVAMFATMYVARQALQSFMSKPVDTPAIGGAGGGTPKFDTVATYDSGGMFTGGRMYDMGGPTTEHGMAILQKGETVIPKTRNMLDGGITLNIGGDIVTDNAEDFAERIAQVLPEALRRQSDIGGI